MFITICTINIYCFFGEPIDLPMKTANYAVEIEFLFKYAGQTAW
jgi:hypothetical protein